MFSLFDGSDYFNSGLNSPTKEECADAGLEHFYDIYSDDGFGDVPNNVKSLNIEEKESMLETSFGVTIEEHTTLLNEF